MKHNFEGTKKSYLTESLLKKQSTVKKITVSFMENFN